MLAATALFIALALLQSLVFPASSDYLRQASLGIRPLQNLHFYAGSIAALWDAGIGTQPRLLLAGVVTVFALLGFWKQCSNELDLPTFFSLGYGAFLIFWPLAQAIYLLPIVPVYFYFFALSLQEIRDFAARRWRLPNLEIANAVLVLLLFVYVIKYAKSHSGPDPNAFDSPAAMQVYAFFRNSTPAGTIVISSTPRAVALYTDRNGAVFPQSPDAAELSKFIPLIGASYLLLSRTDSNQLAALCRSLSAPVPVFSNSGYTVYKTRINR